MKIFIAGSIKIKELNNDVKTRLENIINKNFTVLVGDAPGVDKNIQEYLLENNYKNVKVYTSVKRARNNVGKWQVAYADPKGKVGREKHTVKDIKMAEDGDYGLMIWDGESQGTLNNVINLIYGGKKVTIYLHKEEYRITSKEDLIKFIESLNEKIQKLYIKLVAVANERVEEKTVQKNKVKEVNSQLAIGQQPKIEAVIKNIKVKENNQKEEKKVSKFNYVSFLWSIAESLRGTYKAEDYGKVMLPMIVLRRFDCILDAHDRQQIKDIYNETTYVIGTERDEMVIAEAEEVYNQKNMSFFNISDYNFQSLLNDSENIAENLKEYINGFSENVRKIMDNFKFTTQIDHLNKKNKLYAVIQKFSEVDIHMDKVANEEMGKIYEEMIRKFYENTDAGEHYTPREVVELCMEMLFYTKEEFIEKKGKLIDIADFCVGTGGMLSEARRYVEKHNKDAEIQLYGQELMDESFAICQADMIMKGESPENIRLGNTLSEDKFRGDKFRFLISNPPYGVTWKDEEKAIKQEAELGFDGRFGAGTPRVSDGSLLFLQNMINKMKTDEDGSRIAIILNGSPLFTGDAGSGESNIRRWIIESDMLEGIIALPTDMFYNTGISTYIWVLTNKKNKKRKGKIQLVDGSNFYKSMRKSLGNKRKRISKKQIKEIKEIYDNFEESELSKIFDNADFGFRKITVDRPLKLKFEINEESLDIFKNSSQYINLAVSKKKKEELKEIEEAQGREKQEKLIESLSKITKIYLDREEFLKDLKAQFKADEVDFVKGALLKAIWSSIGVRDEEATVCRNSKGFAEADTSLRDSETIPLKEDVTEYFQREVLPHVPDVVIDQSTLDKIGYEIPFTRHFYKYEKLRGFEEIMAEISTLEEEIQEGIKKVLS